MALVVGILVALMSLAGPTDGVAISGGAGPGQEEQERVVRIDVNEAASDELQEVPGIGPAMARRIIEWREQHGRFERLEDLLNVRGIGSKTLEKLRPYLRVGADDERA